MDDLLVSERVLGKSPENRWLEVGRRLFPFGAIWAYFHGRLLLVSGRVNWTLLSDEQLRVERQQFLLKQNSIEVSWF